MLALVSASYQLGVFLISWTPFLLSTAVGWAVAGAGWAMCRAGAPRLYLPSSGPHTAHRRPPLHHAGQGEVRDGKGRERGRAEEATRKVRRDGRGET